MSRPLRAVWIASWLAMGLAAFGCVDYLSTGTEPGPGFDSPDPAKRIETRVLFIMDASQSMLVSDPDQRRVQAATDVIHRLIQNPNAQIGLLVFNGQARSLVNSSGYFTGNLAQITEALVELGQASGPTSFAAALDLAETAIRNEAGLFQTPDRHRLQFHLVFLSDGVPGPLNSEIDPDSPAAIINRVEDLLAAGEELGLAGVTLHTALVANLLPEEMRLVAAQLLAGMASKTGGDYLEFQTAEQISFEQLAFGPPLTGS